MKPTLLIFMLSILIGCTSQMGKYKVRYIYHPSEFENCQNGERCILVKGDYTLQKSIQLLNKKDIVLDASSSTITMAANAPIRNGYSLINMRDCNQISFKGFILDGNRAARDCEENYAHTVIMANCSQIQISNTTINNSVVDGILMVAGTEGDTTTYCRDISIENVKIESSCRNGISIINAYGVKLNKLHISNSNGLSPAAGIDVESDVNFPAPSNKNITITDCYIADNKGCGIMTSQKGSPENIRIANNTILNCEIGIFVASKKTKVENNIIRNSVTFGIQSVRYDNENIDFNELSHNVIEKAKVGIHYSGENGRIIGNKINTVSQSGIWLNGNTVNKTSVLIDSNEVTGSVEFGIYANNFALSEISNNTVSSAAKEGISVINGKSRLQANAISNSETGFNITGSNIELFRNVVASCQTGISAIGGNKISLSGKVSQNKFIKVKNLWYGDFNKFTREANEEIK